MIYGIAIFVSAFLLFQVQLIAGKMLLPWFGGAPSVWTTCMLFFQGLLLLGYGYAHWLNGRSAKAQTRIHFALLIASFASLALATWHSGAPLNAQAPPVSSEGQPIASIFRLLLLTTGMPFFALSTTSPLLQRWYALSRGASPYRLYAASNAGSMLGLITYPFAVEPLFGLRVQSWIWGASFVVFAAMCVWCMRSVSMRGLETARGEASASETAGPTVGNTMLWLVLSAVTSALLLAVTNSLCQDIAVVPFLWVLPLAIYLLTFILCFESTRWYRRRWYVLAGTIASLVVLVTNFQGVHVKVVAHVISYSTFLFLFCMLGHGELVRLKPSTRHLTRFYLVIAAGGAAGALFVAIGAPMWFRGFWELHIALLAGWIVLAIVFVRDQSSFFFTGDRSCFLLLCALLTYAALKLALQLPRFQESAAAAYDVTIALGGAVTVSAFLAWVLRRRRAGTSRIWPRILVGAILFLGECFLLNRMRNTYFSSVEVTRNFYGAIRVTRNQVGEQHWPALYLTHGHIGHGLQYQPPALRDLASSYYSSNSGLGMAVRFHARRRAGRETNLNIGVLGLGVGTIAAYARSGDAVRFYEINPAVADLSTRAHPRFTFVRDCRGKAEVVPGDARLSLERELARGERGNYDLLVMDAFSGDSVPVHLLTTEAFETYLAHMRDEHSIIAVNISNRFLDFRDLMGAIAERFQMRAVFIDCRGDPPDRTPSRWCLFTRDTEFASTPDIQRARLGYPPRRVSAWTDQFSNMLQLLR